MKLVQRLPVNLYVDVLSMGFLGREKKELRVNRFIKEIVVIHGDKPMINVVTAPGTERSSEACRVTVDLPSYVQLNA